MRFASFILHFFVEFEFLLKFGYYFRFFAIILVFRLNFMLKCLNFINFRFYFVILLQFPYFMGYFLKLLDFVNFLIYLYFLTVFIYFLVHFGSKNSFLGCYFHLLFSFLLPYGFCYKYECDIILKF